MTSEESSIYCLVSITAEPSRLPYLLLLKVRPCPFRLPQSDMLQLMEATPSRHAMTFAKWLITGENQLDSKSRDKAYQLWDSTLLQTIEVGTVQGAVALVSGLT